jgi:hydrogenase nickel incorporation protein HypA/HybF
VESALMPGPFDERRGARCSVFRVPATVDMHQTGRGLGAHIGFIKAWRGFGVHELSLAQRVVEIIEDAAAREAFARVRRVWLEVGLLSCVEPAAMRAGFEAAARDTLAEGAALELIPVAGRGRCPACGTESALEAREDACPRCGGYGLRPIAGTALRLRELEVE